MPARGAGLSLVQLVGLAIVVGHVDQGFHTWQDGFLDPGQSFARAAEQAEPIRRRGAQVDQVEFADGVLDLPDQRLALALDFFPRFCLAQRLPTFGGEHEAEAGALFNRAHWTIALARGQSNFQPRHSFTPGAGFAPAEAGRRGDIAARLPVFAHLRRDVVEQVRNLGAQGFDLLRFIALIDPLHADAGAQVVQIQHQF